MKIVLRKAFVKRKVRLFTPHQYLYQTESRVDLSVLTIESGHSNDRTRLSNFHFVSDVLEGCDMVRGREGSLT